MTEKAFLEFNISSLLDPIPGKKAWGENLRYTETYDKIKEARREDNERLPQGVWKAELKRADWDQVDQLCQDALKNQSKDLQIAIWWTEARLYLEGMEGLTQGLSLILELTRTYWKSLYPQIEKGGHELRLALYEWINTRLSAEVHFIPVVIPSDKTAISYRLLDFNEASQLELSTKRKQASGGPAPTDPKQLSLNKIALSISQTPTTYYQSMDKNCRSALKIITELEDELRNRLVQEAPKFSRLREQIELVQRFASQLIEARGERKEMKKAASVPESQVLPYKGVGRSIETREQAYAILGEVAAYLERIEPHSPTPYLIHRAISWGEMNLSQVVSNVLTEEGNLSLLLDILNVKKEPQ